MRRTIAALTGAAALAASAALLASPAQAYRCPPPLENHDTHVAGRTLPGCRLGPIIQCDPDPCVAVRS